MEIIMSTKDGVGLPMWRGKCNTNKTTAKRKKKKRKKREREQNQINNNNNGHARNSLTLWNAFVNVQLHIPGDTAPHLPPLTPVKLTGYVLRFELPFWDLKFRQPHKVCFEILTFRQPHRVCLEILTFRQPHRVCLEILTFRQHHRVPQTYRLWRW